MTGGETEISEAGPIGARAAHGTDGARVFREHLYTEQLRHFVNLSGFLAVSDGLAALAIVLLLGNHVDSRSLAVWAVLVWGVAALRGILWQRERDATLDPENTTGGAIAELTVLTVAGGLWAAAIVFLWPPVNPIFQGIFVFAVCGYSAFLITILACHPVAPSLYGFVVGSVATYGLSIHMPSQSTLFLGLALVIMCALLGISLRTHRLLRENIWLEYQLSSAGEAAQSAGLAKSQFIANMSHELRTPLNAILGFSEIIRDRTLGAVPETKYTQYAADIHESGRHLLDVINDILDLSKVEAGKMVLAEDNVDLSRIINSSVHLVRNSAEDAGVTLNVQLPDELPYVLADERAIRQILLNLLSNAIKFTPLGGEVKTEVKLAPNGDLAITVRDNGIGIDPDQIPTALEPFGQIDASMTRRYEGTGLGLPLVKSLAELHGGRLRLQSELGVGTSVTMILPANRLSTDNLCSQNLYKQEELEHAV